MRPKENECKLRIICRIVVSTVVLTTCVEPSPSRPGPSTIKPQETPVERMITFLRQISYYRVSLLVSTILLLSMFRT